MEISRINSYDDARFSQNALYQHGCFIADGEPYEVEIISEYEAVVRGRDPGLYQNVIDEFRFFTPHITQFYDAAGGRLREFTQAELITIPLDMIQPSQFFVDRDKLSAVSRFIHCPEDIIIQALPFKERYISLDGHTRLYLAALNGWKEVRGVIDTADDWIYVFADEAKKRGILAPGDMELVEHAEYEEKWNSYCDELLGRSSRSAAAG